MELRKHPRYTLGIPAAFWGGVTEGKGVIQNISTGGATIESDTVPTTGTYLTISALLPDGRVTLVIDLAPVRWSFPRHFGVEFIQMQPEAQAALRRLVDTLKAGAD